MTNASVRVITVPESCLTGVRPPHPLFQLARFKNIMKGGWGMCLTFLVHSNYRNLFYLWPDAMDLENRDISDLIFAHLLRVG